MSLRFFSDQCLPAEITGRLRRHGHRVTLLREVLPVRSLDPAVIATAHELGTILFSLSHKLFIVEVHRIRIRQ